MTTDAAPVAPAPRAFEAVPGPRGWPLLGVAPQLRREAFHRQLEGWAGDYGDVFAFRLGKRRFLAVADPEVIANVLRRRPGEFRRGRRLEQVSREMGFLGLFSANGETWRRQRPMVLHGLDPTHIRSYLPADLEIESVRGIRVLTPVSHMHRWPVVAPILRALERGVADLPILRRLGGFLLVGARKRA